MANFRTLCALALSAAVVAGCSGEPVAPGEQGTIRLSSGVQVIYDRGLKLGHCFEQVGITAPRVTPVAGGTVLAAPAGKVVTRVAIKAGAMCLFTPETTDGTFTFNAGGSPCYLIEGLNTAAATVRRVGVSTYCKDIAKLEFLSDVPPVTGGGTGGGETGGGTGGGETGGGSTAPPGAMTVCEAATRPVAEPLNVTIGSGSAVLAQLAVAVGQCSAPTSLGAGSYMVSQALPAGFTMLEIFVEPEGLIVSADPFLGTATVRVDSGVTTTVTFLNDSP